MPSYTPLHFAVINGDIEIVKMILGKGANIDAKHERGRTSLHIAIQYRKMEVTELLIKHGADVNAVDNDGKTPLHVAAAIRCLQVVEQLLNYGANVNCVAHNSRWNQGYAPLHFAVEEGDEEIVKLLLNRGADINASAKDNLTPLHIATKKGHETVVKLLLQHGAKVDSQDKDSKTILHLTVEKGHLTIVKNVLKYCPDINNESNRSSLKIAVHDKGENFKNIVEALLEYGLMVNPEDKNISELLHAAVEKGYLKIIEDLLKYGADVNTLNNSKESFTPLHSAAKYKQEEVAKLLISHKADINAQDNTGKTQVLYCGMVEALLNTSNMLNNSKFKEKGGKTPIFYAIENADLKITNLLLTNGANIKDSPELLNTAVKKGCMEIVKALLKHDADINASDKYGRTPLHYTALGEEDLFFFTPKDPNIHIKGDIAKLLLSKGANVDAQTKDGVTALHCAVENGYAKVVEVLLEFNANINSGVKVWCTPLHLGAKEGNQEIIETILKFGANINARDNKYGRTALHVASEEGHYKVVETLLEYGAEINITDRNNQTALDHAMAGIRANYKRRLNSYDSDFVDFFHDPDHSVPSCEITAETLKVHIVKMKTANLYVSKKNLLSFAISLRLKSSKLSDFKDECEKEIASMKSEKINNLNTSFYDILAKGTSSLAIYMRNENIVQVLKSDDYKTKFPIYASMIQCNFRKGMERKKVVEQGYEVIHLLFNNFPELPYNCTEKIFSYLSDADLRILMDACKPLGICNPNTNINDVVITSSICQVQNVQVKEE